MTLEDILNRIDEMLEKGWDDVDNDFVCELLQQIEINLILKEAAKSFDAPDIFQVS